MPTYAIQVTETIIHYIDVPARTLEDALEKAKDMINDETVWHIEVETEKF